MAENALARPVRLAIFALPLAIVAVLVWLKTSDPWRYYHFAGREDGPVEWATALVYFLATPLALWLLVQFRRRRMPLLALLAAFFTLGLLFVALEEISWGQRLFGFQTPGALAEINRQEELNLHNIGGSSYWLDRIYLAVTFYALTARFWLAPLLRRGFGEKGLSIAALLSPPGFLAPYFLIHFLLYLFYVTSPLLVERFGSAWGFGYSPDGGYFMLSRDQEPSELILGLGFLLFACWLALLMAKGRWGRVEMQSLPR